MRLTITMVKWYGGGETEETMGQGRDARKGTTIYKYSCNENFEEGNIVKCRVVMS